MSVTGNRKTQYSQWLSTFAASAIILILTYLASVLYIRSTGEELVNGWLQNEAVEIQQGNLLSAITKNQRMLLSSDFIKGVALIDPTREKYSNMIAFGRRIQFTPAEHLHSHGALTTTQNGLFSFETFVLLQQERPFYVGFAVAPTKSPILFGVFALTLLSVLGFYGYRAVQTERHEAARTANVIRIALEDLVHANEPSTVLVHAAPRLVDRWFSLKSELEISRQREINLAAKANLADLAKSVAHDIRSPLSALNAAAGAITTDPEQARQVMKSAIERINRIAEDLLEGSRTKSPTTEASKVVDPAALLKDIYNEKLAEIGANADLKISLDFKDIGDRIRICADKADLGRALSNLVNNSLEAIDENGSVKLVLREHRRTVVIAIVDDGRGIPPEVLSKLGTDEISYGKSASSNSGSGLGVLNASRMVKNSGGKMNIQSKVGDGTIVTITFDKIEA